MIDIRIVVGDRAKELRALQLLALALSEAASRLSRQQATTTSVAVVAPLLLAAAHALSIASCAGLDTPIEVLALSARNTFELWLRLGHIVTSEANCQRWRDEALMDQLQVYTAILTLDSRESVKSVIRDEIERVKRHGEARGLAAAKPMMACDLAKEAKSQSEYDAFYKLYSKLVHPSSWSVNGPGAVSSAMYHDVLTLNAQTYGWRILETIENVFDVSARECYELALACMRQTGTGEIH